MRGARKRGECQGEKATARPTAEVNVSASTANREGDAVQSKAVYEERECSSWAQNAGTSRREAAPIKPAILPARHPGSA